MLNNIDSCVKSHKFDHGNNNALNDRKYSDTKLPQGSKVRKKVEYKINQAVAELGRLEYYRIDKVREKTGTIRKVFDKTILDMARVGTIELLGGDTTGMNPSEIGNLIQYGDQMHVYFKFPDAETEPEAQQPKREEPESSKTENIEIVLLEIEPEMWQRFGELCQDKDDKAPVQKIREMIWDYIKGGM
jgi:hypothetical protein